MPLRQFLGALAHDGLRFERAVRGRWERMKNRSETITVAPSGRGVRCEWQWTSPVDYCRFVPRADVRLLRAALKEWPIASADSPADDVNPEVTFLIGHRGLARLPQLLMTLRSIAAQSGVRVECIVIEQSHGREVENSLPEWVRYLHQPVNQGHPYNRAATFNAGAAAARGRILILHDNDMLVPMRYAAEVVAHANAGWEAIDLKRFIFYLTENDTARVLHEGQLRLDERTEIVIQNLHGGSVAVTREAYDAIGGFDEAFIGWGGEDVEFWERASTRRATAFGFLPIVHLWHAPQAEKLQVNEAPALKLYAELARVPAEERIARLRQKARTATSQRAEPE
ncbi:MAG: glycosyltransferase [Acidobacteria bacterium]|nr:glycosyltransferase [Acidobacteriota bacterium]MBV9188148.1 glycosyltransferase [Acidobacteriota bacterium]